MAKKFIYINDIRVGYATSAKVEPEINTEKTPTFDGPVVDGTEDPSHTVEIEKLRYGTIKEYIQLEQLLINMYTKGYPIKIIEDVTMKDGTMRVTDIVYDCKLDGNDYELDPEERTAENLSFKGGNRKRWINGKEIKKTIWGYE